MRYYSHKTVCSTKIGIGFAQIDYVFELEERTSTHIMDDTKTIVQIDSAGTTETIRYQSDNHLGSASLELDEDANIISYEEYHPFGTTSYRSGRSETEVSLKRYKYVGKERDEETGLYYYGARYYAGWLCRWTAVDPLAREFPWHSPFMSFDGNPINKIDPTGMSADWVEKTHEDGSKSIEPDGNVTSPDDPDLQTGDKYLGKQGYGINEETGNLTSYNSDGTQSDAGSILLDDVNVSGNSEKHYNIKDSRGRGLYNPGTQILKSLSYAYNYGRKTLPSTEMNRWNGKLTMVDLIKFCKMDNNPGWEKTTWNGIYSGEWKNGEKAILKADNAFNIDVVKKYDYGNYKNSIVLWLEPSGFPDPHTGIILKLPNSTSMERSWDYITKPNSWIP